MFNPVDCVQEDCEMNQEVASSSKRNGLVVSSPWIPQNI